jgi:hypothetical protein
MKNLKNAALSALFLVFISFSLYAQKGSAFGFKGGLNYSSNGDYFSSIEASAQNPERNLGYHFGVFGKLGNRIYLRPELVYTATKSDYNSEGFEMKKIDAPLLVGVKILGPLSVFAGPSLQYIIDSQFDGINIDNVNDDFSVGLNFGFGVNFNKIGIDLRYERGFNSNEATFIDNNIGTDIVSRIDTRPDQLILSLSIAL